MNEIKSKASSWPMVEEEFDKEFPEFGFPRGTRNDRMKEFIRTHLDAAREEGRKEGLKEALELVPLETPGETIRTASSAQINRIEGYEACRAAIIKAIEERI